MGFFKTVVSSAKKSKELNRISKILGKQPDADEMLDSILGDDDTKERAEEDLFNLVESNPDLNKLMVQYGATRDTLRDIYHALNYSGAGQWCRGHYVSVSSLVFGTTLDYLLRNKDAFIEPSSGKRMSVCYRLIMYFEKGETGYIRD